MEVGKDNEGVIDGVELSGFSAGLVGLVWGVIDANIKGGVELGHVISG